MAEYFPAHCLRGLVSDCYLVSLAIPLEDGFTLLIAEFCNQCDEYRSHTSKELGDVEGNLEAAAQFADANIIHTRESPVKETVRQFDVVDEFQQAGNADQRVNLGAFVDAGNLDFVVLVDLPGSVIQLFHNLVFFGREPPRCAGPFDLTRCEVKHYF